MILMVLGAYFGAVTPEELIVFLETGMKREADLLMAPGKIQQEQADALYAVTYLQMNELRPFLTEWYKTSDFAFSGLMLAECRKYHIDAVAKYTAIMKFLQFDEALFIREGREFLHFQREALELRLFESISDGPRGGQRQIAGPAVFPAVRSLCRRLSVYAVMSLF